MEMLVLYFSVRGNNKLLAEHLARRLGADAERVRDARWFPRLHMPRDLMKDDLPPIKPIAADVSGYDSVLFVAPVFAGKIAMPMKSAIAAMAPKLPSYSFVSLCGYDRPDQRKELVAQLTDLTGKAPEHLGALSIGDLVAEKDRKSVWVVSNFKVREAHLTQFSSQIDEIASWNAT